MTGTAIRVYMVHNTLDRSSTEESSSLCIILSESSITACSLLACVRATDANHRAVALAAEGC